MRLDETGTWHVDRHVLLQGTANLGRLKSALIVETGSAVEVIQRFLDLAGSTWFDDPVEEDLSELSARLRFKP